jgi:hypothetical protein
MNMMVPKTAHSNGKLKISIIADKKTAKIKATKKTEVPIASRNSTSLAMKSLHNHSHDKSNTN